MHLGERLHDTMREPCQERGRSGPVNPSGSSVGHRILASISSLRYAVMRNHSVPCMDQHLTVTEARKLTGKSDSTIKRMIREITQDANHSDRSFILPSHDEVERRKKASAPYVWRIDRELLRRRFDVGGQSDEEEKPMQHAIGGGDPDIVLQVLREQLKSKDDQLRTLETQLNRKDEQIANLNERMRESNILMKELQQRLAITAPAVSSTTAGIVDRPKQGSETRATKNEKAEASGKKVKKKSAFSRWFTLR